MEFEVGGHYCRVVSNIEPGYSREVILRKPKGDSMALLYTVMDALSFVTEPIPTVQYSGDFEGREQIEPLVERVVALFNAKFPETTSD